ncbi:hypothetical protein CP533_1297 [Ophiocordyceps camponoti-saundersi (nom. inval.)]|nr:hypothetical protein CP533_1297 [Ophiocordyceps camponoti-saundersi (nom. inval.)]
MASASSLFTTISSDPELGTTENSYLYNSHVRHLKWTDVSVRVKGPDGKKSRLIVSNASGVVEAGEMCALIGPSGSGKTTLLNVLARNNKHASSTDFDIKINGNHMPSSEFRKISRSVDQDDALIGSLTVRETIDFSSRLASSHPGRRKLVDSLLDSFGLKDQARTVIGTPFHQGVSTGERRRVSVASQLITGPKVLFLDEPTSGLDSLASWQIISYLKAVVKSQRLIVVLSIHQPSAAILQQFDKLFLLSNGQTHYFGPVDQVEMYYKSIGCRIPRYVNQAEFLLEQLNINFAKDKTEAEKRIQEMQQNWERSDHKKYCQRVTSKHETEDAPTKEILTVSADEKPGVFSVVLTLLHRGLLKSYRDPMVYTVRLAIYIAFAIVMGTIWLRLQPTQSSIQPFINAMFFGSVFISFLSVSYVPAFLEDRLQYSKEYQNGLYGATEFLTCNIILGLPFLFILSLAFSIIVYWLANFQPTFSAFFTWLTWLYLELIAAESVTILAACFFPTFVLALAIVIFANGLWISVSGFMVPLAQLNAFYKYGFSYWNYQKYVFEGMMRNEFADRIYSCGPGCHCMYNTSLASRCQIEGKAILDQYGFTQDNTTRNVCILIVIILVFRFAALITLKMKK